MTASGREAAKPTAYRVLTPQSDEDWCDATQISGYLIG